MSRLTLVGQTLLAMALLATADATEWQNPSANGDWSDPGNWLGGIVPTSNVEASIGIGAANITTDNAVAGDLYVGSNLGGSLNIAAGGKLTSAGGNIGSMPSSQGSVTVRGVWQSNTENSLWIGNQGRGVLNIESGGAANFGSSSMGIGLNSGGDGQVTVRGTLSSASMVIGDGGRGTLKVESGGSVALATDLTMGVTSFGVGDVSVRGTLSMSNLLVGYNGTADFSLGQGGLARVTDSSGGLRSVSLATLAGSNGTFTIGGKTTPEAPGRLHASEIVGGSGAAVLKFNHTIGNYTFTNQNSSGIAIKGSTSVEILSGSTTFTASNSYTGGTTITGGSLRAGAPGALVPNSNYTINSGSLDLNGFGLAISQLNGSGGSIVGNFATLSIGSGNFSGDFSGVGVLQKTGSGTLILTGKVMYEISATISGGILQIGDGSEAKGLGAGPILNNATLIFDHSGYRGVAGIVSGSGSIVKRGTGFLEFSAANSFSGSTIIDNGTVVATNERALSRSLVILSGGQLQFSRITRAEIGGLSGTGTLDIEGLNLTVSGNTPDVSFSGTISGSGSVIKTGSGAWRLSGTNTYTGGTSLRQGLLRAESDSALPQGTAYAISGGTLDLNGHDLTLSSLNGNSGVIDLSDDSGGGSTLTVNGSGEFGGNISGTGQLKKDGPERLLLKGDKTYSAGTDVISGSLAVSNAGSSGSATGTGPLRVHAEGTLEGAGRILGATSIEGSLSPGTNGTGVLFFGSHLLLGTESVLKFDLADPSLLSDSVVISGDFVLDGTLVLTSLGMQEGTYTLFTYSGAFEDRGLTLFGPSGYDYTLEFQDGLVSVTVAVPEPSLLSLLALAFCGFTAAHSFAFLLGKR